MLRSIPRLRIGSDWRLLPPLANGDNLLAPVQVEAFDGNASTVVSNGTAKFSSIIVNQHGHRRASPVPGVVCPGASEAICAPVFLDASTLAEDGHRASRAGDRCPLADPYCRRPLGHQRFRPDASTWPTIRRIASVRFGRSGCLRRQSSISAIHLHRAILGPARRRFKPLKASRTIVACVPLSRQVCVFPASEHGISIEVDTVQIDA
jgi:hypothetical protein